MPNDKSTKEQTNDESSINIKNNNIGFGLNKKNKDNIIEVANDQHPPQSF